MRPETERGILAAARPVAPGAPTGGTVMIEREARRDGGASAVVRVDYDNGGYVIASSHERRRGDPLPQNTIEIGTRGTDGKDVPLSEINNATANGSWHPDTVTGQPADPKLIEAGQSMLKAAGERVTPRPVVGVQPN